MHRGRVLVELALVTGVIISASCDARPSPRPWSFDRNVGIAYLTHERSCVVSRADDWQSDTQVQLVEPASGRSARAVVVGPLDACAATSTGEPRHGYELRVDDERLETPLLGIALAGFTGAVSEFNGSPSADLDADGQPEFFRSCTSTEGVHLTIWSGAVLTGPRRWHGYHYLGFDVAPTCTERDGDP